MTQAALIGLIITYCQLFDVNPKIALAVARVESNFKANVISPDGKDIGLFQLSRPSYPGYSLKALLNPHINVFLGVKTLANMKRVCQAKMGDTWINCYNLGVEGASKLKFPRKWRYYRRVKLAMKSS